MRLLLNLVVLVLGLLQASAFVIPGRRFGLPSELKSPKFKNIQLSMSNDAFGKPSFGAGGRLPMDVKEMDNAFKLVLDLPGVNKEDIHIGVDEGVLTIKAKRETFREEESKEYRRVERSAGEVSRSLSLPKTVDISKIDADYIDGVLTVNIRKFTQSELDAKVVKIAVK